MSDQPTEKDAQQWAVRAENGTTCFASEEVAHAAVTEGGYTLGPDRSLIVAALTRSGPGEAWRVIPPAKTEETP